jgi:hypothetical protein
MAASIVTHIRSRPSRDTSKPFQPPLSDAVQRAASFTGCLSPINYATSFLLGLCVQTHGFNVPGTSTIQSMDMCLASDQTSVKTSLEAKVKLSTHDVDGRLLRWLGDTCLRSVLQHVECACCQPGRDAHLTRDMASASHDHWQAKGFDHRSTTCWQRCGSSRLRHCRRLLSGLPRGRWCAPSRNGTRAQQCRSLQTPLRHESPCIQGAAVTRLRVSKQDCDTDYATLEHRRTLACHEYLRSAN